MALEKAIITKIEDSAPPIAVMFNPEEYTLTKDINYAQTAIPGLGSPLLQFVNGGLQTLEMELFLDSYEIHQESNKILNQAGEDVRHLTRKITDLIVIDPATHAPPLLLFTWGSLSFTCVLAHVTQRFILFLPNGTPVRARLQVTFNEFKNAEQESKEVKRETADFTKIYEVGQHETLSNIAGRVYGNPRLWRPIALSNGFDNPLFIPVGTRLVIPHLPYRDPTTGEVYP
jgi:hypothetical protein